jgi:predicted RNA binding protein YcfA (HicA-like mRNA interferase family)
MSGLPVVKPRQLIRVLEKLGFKLVRKSRGSRWRFAAFRRTEDDRACPQGKEIGPGLLRKILRDVEISADDLRDQH